MSKSLSTLAFLVVIGSAAAAQPWLGSWESHDTKTPENWEAVIGALGLPAEKFGGNPKTTFQLTKDGDSYKSVLAVPSKNYAVTLPFTLGVEGTHIEPAFNNVEIKYTYTESGDNLLAEVKVPSKNKVFHDTYEVIGNELVKTYKVDGVEGKRWFKRA